MLSSRLDYKKIFILNLLSKKKKEELKLGQTLHRMYLSTFSDKFQTSKHPKPSSNEDILNLEFGANPKMTPSKVPIQPVNSDIHIQNPENPEILKNRSDRIDGYVGEWNFDPEDDPEKFLKEKANFFDAFKKKKENKKVEKTGFFGIKFFEQKDEKDEKMVDEILAKQREKVYGVEKTGRRMYRVIDCEDSEVYIRHIDFHSIGKKL